MNDRTGRFDNIAVVLVKPAGKRNIGQTARAMKNCGFTDLVLVAPPDFHCREAYDMAPNSHDVLDRARCFDTLEEALADRRIVFAVTARMRFKNPRITPAEAVVVAGETAGAKTALLFGPEDHGLSNEHLSFCRHLVGIPSHPDLESLNVSQAVLVICHAFYSARSPDLSDGEEKRDFSTIAGKRRIEAALSSLFVEAEFMTPAREKPLRDTLKRLVYGGDIESRDTRNLLAAIRHLRYVLKDDK